MSKRLIQVAIGILLTGCTINHYGPRISVGEKDSPIAVDVSIDKEDREPPVAPQPPVVVHHEAAKTKEEPRNTSKTVYRTKQGCIPMPVISDPPKIDITELAKFSNDKEQLQRLFEKNHADLFKHAKEVKRMMLEWYQKPNHC